MVNADLFLYQWSPPVFELQIRVILILTRIRFIFGQVWVRPYHPNPQDKIKNPYILGINKKKLFSFYENKSRFRKNAYTPKKIIYIYPVFNSKTLSNLLKHFTPILEVVNDLPGGIDSRLGQLSALLRRRHARHQVQPAL